MAKDPRHRYASPAELVADLLALAEQVGLWLLGHDRKAWAGRRESTVSFLHRHLPWIAPIATLVCVVLFLDLLWSLEARRGQGPLPPLSSQQQRSLDILPTPQEAAALPPGDPGLSDASPACAAQPAQDAMGTPPRACPATRPRDGRANRAAWGPQPRRFPPWRPPLRRSRPARSAAGRWIASPPLVPAPRGFPSIRSAAPGRWPAEPCPGSAWKPTRCLIRHQ